MRIVVCVKQTADGELNPFDACAYETALRIPDSEVILLSMGPEKTEEMLLNLTRLGAKEAILLCDRAFAGADTLATAYTLGLAVKKLSPDLVICGRQTIDGDTGQTGPSLSVAAQLSLITNVMQIKETAHRLVCETRAVGEQTAEYPALITVERIYQLRLPSIRSKKGTVIRWNAEDIGADKNRCGLKGSPTRVIASFQNEEGKRTCKFVSVSDLPALVQEGLKKENDRLKPSDDTGRTLKNVWIVGENLKSFAESISDQITVIDIEDLKAKGTKAFAAYIEEKQPEVILWGSDSWSKAVAPQVAALLQTGLCADCTALETDGETLFMYRPAFSGNIMAKIVCTKKPQMATVRTLEKDSADVVIALGKGARNVVKEIQQVLEEKNSHMDKGVWDLAASRAMVDADMLSYDRQVGITGKRVNPAVYLAVGISGAVHHIAGMKQSGLVIAVNPDKKAPIFAYADYGIIGTAEEVVPYL